jgi:hypothetical protein
MSDSKDIDICVDIAEKGEGTSSSWLSLPFSPTLPRVQATTTRTSRHRIRHCPKRPKKPDSRSIYTMYLEKAQEEDKRTAEGWKEEAEKVFLFVSV